MSIKRDVIFYSLGYSVKNMKMIDFKVGNNSIVQINEDNSTDLIPVRKVTESWANCIAFKSDGKESIGLRSAQLGALYSIKAHWTVSNESATIVMPTGTGKTEAMIATVVSEMIDRTLIIVPSDLLRKQTTDKFINFGVLEKIGVISRDAIKPAVACLKKTPKNINELEVIIEKSNIIVTTASLIRLFSDQYINALVTGCDALFVDEAHHIAAKTWATLKYKLRSLKCIQFTATPFRNDGKKIDGAIIYNFPLSKAQEQGYFKRISFNPIYEFDEEIGDLAIAKAAVNQLEEDSNKGYDHRILVRAKDKKTANRLFYDVYLDSFPEYNPVLVHSGVKKKDRDNALVSVGLY